MKNKTIKAKNPRYLFSPHLAGLGISYNDPRFPRYDLATCQSSRGKLLITWGLNLAADELVEGVAYVWMGKVWDKETGGQRDNYEAIIIKLN